LLDEYHNRLLLRLVMLLLGQLNLLLVMLLLTMLLLVLVIHVLDHVAVFGCRLQHSVSFTLLRIQIAGTDVVCCGCG